MQLVPGVPSTARRRPLEWRGVRYLSGVFDKTCLHQTNFAKLWPGLHGGLLP